MVARIAAGVGAVLVLTATPVSATAGTGIYVMESETQFAPPTALRLSSAITYDTTAVSARARIRVIEQAIDESMKIGLSVQGLQARRAYGAHVHTRPCGNQPSDSGPRYQNRQDPQRPSTDPAYANPRNEVWLDFTTDVKGNGKATSDSEWRFRPGEARSVVIYARKTATTPGEAGTAGPRLACYTVPLSPNV